MALPGTAERLEDTVYFQAHRGALEEAPENTLAALRHAWAIPGAVPEVDLRTTGDGVIVCLHDDTPGRTVRLLETLAKTPVGELTFAELRQGDAGVTFDGAYAGEKVPSLEEVFTLMTEQDDRQIYLDLKGVDWDALGTVMERFAVHDRTIFVHGDPVQCAALQRRFPGSRTMTWLSGPPPVVKKRFQALAERRFRGISQLQFHLPVREDEPAIVYALDDAFLEDAQRQLTAAGVALQLRPFAFDAVSLRKLLDLGARWFVADAPARFAKAVAEAQALMP